MKAERWTDIAAPLATHPKVRAFPPSRHDLGVRSRHRSRRLRALVLRARPRARASAAAHRRTVYFMPPYILSDDEFALLLRATREIVTRVIPVRSRRVVNAPRTPAIALA
jgi:hypothetical protein